MFQKAKKLNKRVKLLVWGESGVGKTFLALSFPKPVVLDLEGGTDLYGDDFDFDVAAPIDADSIMEAVDNLLTEQHDYRTLIIDPITIYWDMLRKKWSDILLRRNTSGKGYKHEFYDMQMRDWETVKSEHKEFIRKLTQLDMNVIVTARAKVKYKDGELKAIGTTFDGEKNLPYNFDTVVHLYMEGERRMAYCEKDRSRKLPEGKPFENNYTTFEKAFGKSNLSKESKPVKMITDKMLSEINTLFVALNIDHDKAKKHLSKYGATSTDELTMEAAEIILAKLKERKEKEDAKN